MLNIQKYHNLIHKNIPKDLNHLKGYHVFMISKVKNFIVKKVPYKFFTLEIMKTLWSYKFCRLENCNGLRLMLTIVTLRPHSYFFYIQNVIFS